MKFKDLPYKRPDYDKLHEFMDKAIHDFKAANCAEEQFAVFDRVETVYDDLTSDANLARIRYFLDTSDEFYREEMRYISKNSGALNKKYDVISELILNSEYKDELEEKIGSVTLKNLALSKGNTTTETIEDMALESQIVLEYNELISRLTVNFNGEEMPLSMLAPFKESVDREVRKAAFIAEGECYAKIKDKFDDIFERLVKVRDRQAKKLGFSDFIPLGYSKVRRNCYKNSDIAIFKSQVLEYIVPITQEIAKRRCERLNLDSLYFYDQTLPFKDGAAKLLVEKDELLLATKKMFAEMSEKTGEFINMMFDNELFDLYPRKGKLPGGFCSFFYKYNYPFVFANLNGTSIDVYLLTHEFGHALAKFISTQRKDKQYALPSMEISEIHSMAMEYLATPWYPLFFKEDSMKYTISHAEDALFLIAYSCQVDEFQEQIYKNPDMTASERDELWLKLDSIYRPYIDYDDLPFYSAGAGWQRQVHIYKSPFYYIEYGLAEIIALQIFSIFTKDREKAFNCYFDLLWHGSEKTFVELLDALNLRSPLKPDTIKETADDILNFILSLQ